MDFLPTMEMDDQTKNDELPRDMLSKIFSYLPLPNLILCKWWHKMLQDSYFTHWLYKNNPWLPSNGILLSSQFLDDADHTLKLFDDNYQEITFNYPKYSIG